MTLPAIAVMFANPALLAFAPAADALPIPDATTPIGKAISALLLLGWAAVGLWNRRGTKAVENKTDDQTRLLVETLAGVNKIHGSVSDLREEVSSLRDVQETNDALTTEELANLGEKVSEQGADLKALAATVAGHDQKITVLVDGLARVQSVANLRATDRALADGTVAALTPSAPKGDPA